MPSPRISLRKPSLGFSVALPWRANTLMVGAALLRVSAMPSSPMLSLAPNSSLPSTSAPLGSTCDRLSLKSNLLSTCTWPGGSTGTNTLTWLLDVRLILKPPTLAAGLTARLSAALMPIGAVWLNSSVPPRPDSAGRSSLGILSGSAGSPGGGKPRLGAPPLGAVKLRSSRLPPSSVTRPSTVCVSWFCAALAPSNCASFCACCPAGAAPCASPLRVSRILPRLNALG